MTNIYLGKDIKLLDGDIQFSTGQDFKVVSEENNLAQAIESKLRTIKGEYLLNSEYGSELNSDLGLPSTDFILSGVRGHIIETLNQDPRVKEFSIIHMDSDNSKIIVSLSITPITTNKSFNMVFPYYLEV